MHEPIQELMEKVRCPGWRKTARSILPAICWAAEAVKQYYLEGNILYEMCGAMLYDPA